MNKIINEKGHTYGPWLVIDRYLPNYRPENPAWRDGYVNVSIVDMKKFTLEMD